MFDPHYRETKPLKCEFIETSSQLNHFSDSVCLNKWESGGVSSEVFGLNSHSVAIKPDFSVDFYLDYSRFRLSPTRYSHLLATSEDMR
jgi:hypothetical protein